MAPKRKAKAPAAAAAEAEAPPPAAAPAPAPAPAAAPAAPKRRRVVKAAKPVGYYLFRWGMNTFGVLGEDVEAVEELKRPRLLDLEGKKITAVACGGMHMVALADDGSIYTWGGNDEGALGRRTTSGSCWHDPEYNKGKYTAQKIKDEKKLPTSVAEEPGKVQMPDGVVVKQVVAGDGFTFALTDQGAVYGWGAFKEDSGSFYGFNKEVRMQKLPCLVYKPESARDRIEKIVAGNAHVVALTRKGDVLTWGLGAIGQLGRVPEYKFDDVNEEFLTDMLIPAVVPGVDKAAGYEEIKNIFASTYGTFCVTKSGSVVAFGLNNNCNLGLPNGVSDAQAAAAVNAIAAAGAEGAGVTTAAQAAIGAEQEQQQMEVDDAQHGALAFWSPQRVTVFNGSDDEPAIDVAAIAGGKQHTIVLTKQGTLLSWGCTLHGVLGQQAVAEQANKADIVRKPALVTMPSELEAEDIISIAAHDDSSGCVTKQGNLWLWGANSNHYLMAKPPADVDDEDPYVVPHKFRRNKNFGKRDVVALTLAQNFAALLAGEDTSAAPAAADGAGTSAAAAAQ